MNFLASIVNLNLDDVFFLLDHGIVGLGVLLAILMFNLLRKAQNMVNPNATLIRLIHFFFITSIVLFFLGASIQVLESLKKPSVSIETDPIDPRLWRENVTPFNLFNSHYYLEINELFETHKEKVDHGVKFQLLCFGGNDPENIASSKKKFERMRSFARKLNGETTINDQNFEVRIIRNQKMPGISFFNSKRNNNDIVVYYLDLTVNRNGDPLYGFEVSHEKVVKSFGTEFWEYWEVADKIPLTKILDENISIDSFY